MAVVYLALGSNVGNKLSNIKNAVQLLGRKIKITETSKVYQTTPMGVSNQDNFLNAAVKGETTLNPKETLKFVKEIEKEIGRIERFRWGPREIDIDIIFYDSIVFKDSELEIPHPRMHERDFVLKPLMDINPKFTHPTLNKTVEQLYDSLSSDQRHVTSQVDGL